MRSTSPCLSWSRAFLRTIAFWEMFLFISWRSHIRSIDWACSMIVSIQKLYIKKFIYFIKNNFHNWSKCIKVFLLIAKAQRIKYHAANVNKRRGSTISCYTYISKKTHSGRGYKTTNVHTIILHIQIYKTSLKKRFQCKCIYWKVLCSVFTNNLIFQMDKAIYMKIFKSIKTCKEDSTTDKLDARQRMDKMLLLQQHAFTSQGYFVRKSQCKRQAPNGWEN